MISRIAVRDGNRGRIEFASFPGSSVVPAHRERRGIGMHVPCLGPEHFARPQSDACKQRCRVVFIEPVQGVSQTIIVEYLGSNPWTRQVFNGLIGNELRD